jgi:tetratricopeptide (TPR) repeat protein
MRKVIVALAMGASLSLIACTTADHRTLPAASRQTSGSAYWLDQLAAALKAQDTKEGYRCLTQIVDHWPEKLPKIDTQTIVWVYTERARGVTADELYVSLSQLFDAYGKTAASREPESLWMTLAFLAAERGHIDRARRVAAHLENPHYLVSIRIDKLFDPIVDANPGAFDIGRASTKYIDDLTRQVESRPRSLHVRLQLVDALLSANRLDEALRLSDGLASEVRSAQPGAAVFDDSEATYWIADSRARVLWALGRRDEAIEELERARQPQDKGYANADLTINLATYLCGAGRPQDAWRVLDEPIWVSPFGLMKVHLLRQWAALQMHDEGRADRELEFMSQHRADDYHGYQEALVVAGRLDEAVRVLAFRLSNSNLQMDALMQLQRFDMATMSPEEQKRMLAWRAFSNRADVQAVVSPVGRIEQWDVGPTQGWD